MFGEKVCWRVEDSEPPHWVYQLGGKNVARNFPGEVAKIFFDDIHSLIRMLWRWIRAFYHTDVSFNRNMLFTNFLFLTFCWRTFVLAGSRSNNLLARHATSTLRLLTTVSSKRLGLIPIFFSSRFRCKWLFFCSTMTRPDHFLACLFPRCLPHMSR